MFTSWPGCGLYGGGPVGDGAVGVDTSMSTRSSKTSSWRATSLLIAEPGERLLPRSLNDHVRGRRPSISASAMPRPAPGRACSGSGTEPARRGPYERPDRAWPACRLTASITISRVVPVQTLEQFEAAANLVGAEAAGTAAVRRSIATQPSWSSPCGLPRPDDQTHDSTILNFRECVAQLMHGS